jgi:hypothetical protein
MIPKGIQNADIIIEACRKAQADLNTKAKPEWTATLDDITNTLESMKTKFFLKTNLAIPVTNACRRAATELQSVATGGDLAKFPEALSRLVSEMENLLKQAKMDGITLT